MKRFALVAIGSAVIALALGCGDKNEKPPLTPDDHEEAGAPPQTPSTPAPATPPGK